MIQGNSCIIQQIPFFLQHPVDENQLHNFLISKIVKSYRRKAGNWDGKYSLSTYSALKDIFENRNRVWVLSLRRSDEKRSEPLGTCCDKRYYIYLLTLTQQFHVWFCKKELICFKWWRLVVPSFIGTLLPARRQYEHLSCFSSAPTDKDKISKVCLCAKSSQQDASPASSQQPVYRRMAGDGGNWILEENYS